jgi:hypothetical protein
MDQVSRPMIIALAATVILAAVWLVVLRPKTADVAATAAAPVTAVAPAKDAAAAADAANAKLSNAADGGATTATPATVAAPAGAATATPAAKPTAADVKAAGARDAAVARDIGEGKVVVLLFWNAKGADDIATRAAVRGISRRGGKVAVHVIPISRVAEYESITQDVTITQSPTTVVIDRSRRGRAISGLSERGELAQAVDDALAGRH